MDIRSKHRTHDGPWHIIRIIDIPRIQETAKDFNRLMEGGPKEKKIGGFGSRRDIKQRNVS